MTSATVCPSNKAPLPPFFIPSWPTKHALQPFLWLRRRTKVKWKAGRRGQAPGMKTELGDAAQGLQKIHPRRRGLGKSWILFLRLHNCCHFFLRIRHFLFLRLGTRRRAKRQRRNENLEIKKNSHLGYFLWGNSCFTEASVFPCPFSALGGFALGLKNVPIFPQEGGEAPSGISMEKERI